MTKERYKELRDRLQDMAIQLGDLNLYTEDHSEVLDEVDQIGIHLGYLNPETKDYV